MLNRCLSRGALTRLGFVAAILAAALFAALGPRRARAEEAPNYHCHPLGQLEAAAIGGKPLAKLTSEQLNFARGLYVVSPGTPVALPPGDAAEIFLLDDGSAWIIYVDGDLGCSAGVIPTAYANLLMQVGRGDVTHAASEGSL